jgi:methylenetetrahydrofolate dehydrogenase (NADP+) / methenyltetrahydrofolate cyclohydrolase
LRIEECRRSLLSTSTLTFSRWARFGELMPNPYIIDGVAIAADVRADVANKVASLHTKTGKVPGLAVVLVGDDAASRAYVGAKGKATVAAGMKSFEYLLPETASEAEVLAIVAQLNADPDVNGILVQLPLPKQIDANKVIATIAADKDVDGFHEINAGRLAIGLDGLFPCTPLGSVHMAKTYRQDLSGLHAVVIGRSNIVGKPVAQLLLRENCTVTIVHSRTKDLPAMCRQADLLVAAIGKPEFVTRDFVKPGAIVIDVGINRVPSRKTEGKTILVGDVDYADVAPIAGAITPVPGGVGPMTIAFLLVNTVRAFEMKHGVKA